MYASIRLKINNNDIIEQFCSITQLKVNMNQINVCVIVSVVNMTNVIVILHFVCCLIREFLQ